MKQILVVDDDPVMQVIYKFLFRTHQDEFELNLVSNGEDALLLLEKNPVDLVILDWRLPGMNGQDILRSIRDTSGTRSLPVVMVTSEEDPEKENAALRIGANHFMSKDDIDRELVTQVRRQLARRPPARPFAQPPAFLTS